MKGKLTTPTRLPQDTVKFNDVNGNLGIVCIDKGDLIGGIRFTDPSNIKGPIKPSSRTSTRVQVNTNIDIAQVISECNSILAKYRSETHDVLMAPFKGNDANGARRRRLDFKTARGIIESALVNLGH